MVSAGWNKLEFSGPEQVYQPEHVLYRGCKRMYGSQSIQFMCAFARQVTIAVGIIDVGVKIGSLEPCLT